MASEEKLEELRQRYRDALREGRTEEATAAFNELRSLQGDGPDVSDEPDDYPEEELDDWETLKGVGPELAEVLYNRFGPLEEFDPEEDDIVEVPGIGESKAEKLLDQL